MGEAEREAASPPNRPEDDVAMSFLDHIGELRKRLIRALLGLVPTITIAWFFKERLLDLLLKPFVEAWHANGLGDPQIHFANPIDPFVSYLKLAGVAGVLLAAPWIFWQVWGFISPGLYRREKRLALPFVLASTLFFAGGAVFGYEIFPLFFQTFLGFSGMLPSHDIRIQPTIMITEYLDFATRMLLAFGVVFEIPVVVTFMAAAGIVDWRQLWRFGRWWLVIAALLAAILTPPDVGSQLMMLGPLLLLYFMSVGLAFLFGRRREKKKKEKERST